MSDYTIDWASVSDSDVRRYQETGFVRVRGIISEDEADRFRAAADRVLARYQDEGPGSTIFRQIVNTWRIEPDLKALSLHPRITRVAERLAGVRLRLWHDHLLVKEPAKSTPTHFHQDQPYWPHTGSVQPISCWVALNDVPYERGCMTFIPGSRRYDTLSSQDLSDAGSLFAHAPQLRYEERVTLPLRAGDCTFHHGRTAHMANANVTEENRYGFAIIYMDATTAFDGADHVVTNPLRDAGELTVGDTLSGDLFPLLSPSDGSPDADGPRVSGSGL